MGKVYPWPHARPTDPNTSHAAIPPNITDQAWKILQVYKNGRELLDHDAYEQAGYGPNARDGQRCSDLRAAGLIARTGNRGITPSGKAGHLCRITEEGKNYIASGGLSTHPPQGGKMPVDISKRVAQYVKMRDLIKVKETEFKEVIGPYKKALDDLNTVLLNHLNAIGGNSLNTDAGTVYRTEKKSASLSDPAAFMDYVIANKAFDLLDRKANTTAVTEFIKENNAPPPGVNFSSTYVVGVRRPTQEKDKND